jgi:hypothetical protein
MVGLHSDDVDADYERLKAAGVDFLEALKQQSAGEITLTERRS